MRAFTLIELIAVMALAALAAVSVVPVMGTAERVGAAGLRDELCRRLMLARAHAMTTGRPTGVRLDIDDAIAELVEITGEGGAPSVMTHAAGDGALRASFGDAAMTDADLDDVDAYDTVWFGHDGTPEFRNGAGEFIGALPRDAVVSLSEGEPVTVRAVTGLIE